MPGFRRLLDHGEVLNRLSRLPGAWELGVRLKDLRRERPVRRRLGELARSVEEAAGSAENARRILVVSPHSWKFPLLVEATTALGLRLRGAEVFVLACDGALEVCDNRTVSFDPTGLCRVCWGRARRTLRAAGLTTLRLSEIAASPALDEALAAIDAAPDDALDTLEVDGVRPWEIAYTSYWRYMLARGMSRGERDIEEVRRFLRATMVGHFGVRAALERTGAQAVLALNGKFHVENAAFRLCRDRGIPFVNYEGGAVESGTIHVHHDRPAADFDFDVAWVRRLEEPFTDEQRERITSFMAARRTGVGNQIRYFDRPGGGGREILRELDLDPERATTVAFTNVLWDSAVIDKDVAFDGIADWAREIVAVIRETPDRQCVIRVHPAEFRSPRRRSVESIRDVLEAAGVGDVPNLAIVGAEMQTDSYALMDLAESVHVYTSTVGIEAGVFGRPLVVSGRAHYARKGFSHDVRSREELREILSGRIVPEASEETRERALRYASFYFFENMLRVAATETSSGVGTTTGEIRARTADDLRPGRFPGLDALIDPLLRDRE